jgi:cell division septum initiation protein DivIVA
VRYTPVELRHLHIGRAFFGGYGRRETDQLLEDIAESFEVVWRERGELSDQFEDLQKRFEVLKQAETLFASTLVSAERAAAEAKESATREAELIVAEAHQEARSVTRSAQGERERLFAEVRRIEMLLRSALGLVEETRSELPAIGSPAPGGPGVLAASASRAERWPRREETREFEAVVPADPGPDLAVPREPVPLEQAPLESVPPETVPPEPVTPIASVPAEAEDDGPSEGRDFAWG